MYRGFSEILSIINISSQKNKIQVNMVIKQKDVSLLDFLWLQGFIYGYKKCKSKKYCIFLKYTTQGNLKLKFSFFKKYLKSNEISNVNFMEKNSTFLVKTNKGIFSHKKCIEKKIGGKLFAKI